MGEQAAPQLVPIYWRSFYWETVARADSAELALAPGLLPLNGCNGVDVDRSLRRSQPIALSIIGHSDVSFHAYAARVAVAADRDNHGFPRGAPGTDLRMAPKDLADADPARLITRLENRLAGFENLKSKTHDQAERLRAEAAHAAADLGKPFSQTAQLAAARQRAAGINQQLKQAASPPEHGNGHSPLDQEARALALGAASLAAQSRSAPACISQGHRRDLLAHHHLEAAQRPGRQPADAADRGDVV